MFGYPVQLDRRPMPIPGDLVIMVWNSSVPPAGWTISRDHKFVWRIWTGDETVLLGDWVALRPTSSWREATDG